MEEQAGCALREALKDMGESEKRTVADRRRQPTPIISRYTLRGRRKSLRRKGDQPKWRYVDRYSPRLLTIIILIFGLNCLDSFFTWVILRNGGCELNPLVESTINLWGKNFWVWKLALVSFCSIILYFHSQFERVRIVIFLLCFLYLGLVFYQFSGLIMNKIFLLF